MIKKLETFPRCQSLRYDFLNYYPTGIAYSYRGYYEDLALGYSDKYTDIAVWVLRTKLIDSIGKLYIGYKGGEYKMDENTKLWVANCGEATQTYIRGIRDDGWTVTILTACDV